ncbi:MAG: RNA-directed DNA polymerase [Chitinophagales bacterium]|nr:RNA-directed DNA polymerase [Hyphomicrobiales bacterium]
MNTPPWIARNLAASFLGSAWNKNDLRLAATKTLGLATRAAQRALINRLFDAHNAPTPPSEDWLTSYFLMSEWFEIASLRAREHPRGVNAVLTPPRFAPSQRFADFGAPKLTAPGELAKWLAVSIEYLDWFADRKRMQAKTDIPLLQHYSYKFAPKKSGPPRLIESPKPQLKAMHRLILREMLNCAPVHECAQGFVRRRSCLTAAKIHAGEHVLITADLKDFFLNTRLSRVHGVFRNLGYAQPVARLLTALCSTSTPQSLFARLPVSQRHDWETRKRFEAPHLPQGAPTSPALANLCAWRLDCRLFGLAKSFGANYTRYADDMAFSGDKAFADRVAGFVAALETIAADEGFALNRRKTRVMRGHTSQRVTGVVVNEHVNIARKDYDRLKAILHNCRRNGPEAENRAQIRTFRAHLDGRVNWVETVNPNRGTKLRRIFNEISW